MELWRHQQQQQQQGPGQKKRQLQQQQQEQGQQKHQSQQLQHEHRQDQLNQQQQKQKQINQTLRQELQRLRKQLTKEREEEDAELLFAKSMCSDEDNIMPCKCNVVITTTKVDLDDGETAQVNFPEFKCEGDDDESQRDNIIGGRINSNSTTTTNNNNNKNVKDNNKSITEGRVLDGYRCEQLMAYRTLYRDAQNQPIQVKIKYRAGCELRCVNEYCIN